VGTLLGDHFGNLTLGTFAFGNLAWEPGFGNLCEPCVGILLGNLNLCGVVFWAAALKTLVGNPAREPGNLWGIGYWAAPALPRDLCYG
jgi:hypothetical protein